MYFGQTMAHSPVIRDLTCGQLAEIIHAYALSQTIDGKVQHIMAQVVRKAFTDTRVWSQQAEELFHDPEPVALPELSEFFEL